MIISLITSLTRITLFWYLFGLVVLFIGTPRWAEERYASLMDYPMVPHLSMHGLGTAAEVQLHLLMFWTVPVLLLWVTALVIGFAVTEVRVRLATHGEKQVMKPRGEFWGVTIASFSLGALPQATTPALTGAPVAFVEPGIRNKRRTCVEAQGAIADAVKLLTPAERQLSEELLQLLFADPHHFAGHGHGVGLLEHTLNVLSEAAAKCTHEFRMPLLAALAHDVGKLVTFQQDGSGEWQRRGLHSRESARILATLPGFQQLPEVHQRALLLAVKYDHAPNAIPELRSDGESARLAMRVISALGQADRTATAAEKDRNLEKLQPEDLLWKDFVDFLREAPVVQRGKKGAANQVNNPPDSPYLFIYEMPWREAAVRRMPAEVAAALDLTRRDAGKLAKYTRILAARLRKEGLLVEELNEMKVSEVNPLWDIQSGSGEKAVVLRGILVLKADLLWKALNYRLSTKSPFPVQILAPNADVDGQVSSAPEAKRDLPKMPEVSDSLKVGDVSAPDAMAAFGLSGEPTESGASEATPPPKPKSRGRGHFRTPPPPVEQDSIFGLAPASTATSTPAANEAPASTPVVTPEPESPMPNVDPEQAPTTDASTASALELLAGLGAVSVTPTTDDTDGGQTEDAAPAVATVDAVEPGADPAPAAPPPAEAETKEAPAPMELSRAERREGLAIADEAALAAYPQLSLGDKYYTEKAQAVQKGWKKPGSRYKGDSKDKEWQPTTSSPRRRRSLSS